MEPAANQPSPAQCWSNVARKEPPQKDPNPDTNLTSRVIVQSCKSAEGISIAVVDANAVIQGGEKLHHLADKFVTVPEVLAEIRDPVSRHRLAIVPFTVDSMEPTPEVLNRVIKFARATGDLQTLSEVDLKLIALTYTLEAQIHGTKHLRDAPPPIHTVNVKRLPENDMPGWGSNVPNLEEWEALEHGVGDGSNTNSRILPLKDISLNFIPEGEQSVDGSMGARGDVHSENLEDVGHGYRQHQQYPPKKKETNIEGKKMIADGVDASQGQFGDDAGDWRPAVSRSTHRRYLRRKARRENYEALSEKDSQQEMDKNNVTETSNLDPVLCQNSEAADSGIKISKESEMTETRDNSEDLSTILKQMRVDKDPLDALQERIGENCAPAELKLNNLTEFLPSSDDNENIVGDAGEADIANSEFDHLEVYSHPPGSIDTSFADDDDSEHSWMLRSLSESSVACVTSDYAMQNVLLQIGLRLLAPGGMQIRQLHRWILKCHACYTVTAEIGRIFCPKCGNGGTLRKVAVTVSENGIILAARRPRIMLRGTKFSLPLPQGGRDAVAKNPILREDQLPQKFLYPKTKKKVNKQGDDFFTSDDFFSHHTDKRAPFQPPIRKALAVFSQKRNPNDNHYSRPKH